MTVMGYSGRCATTIAGTAAIAAAPNNNNARVFTMPLLSRRPGEEVLHTRSYSPSRIVARENERPNHGGVLQDRRVRRNQPRRPLATCDSAISATHPRSCETFP